MDKTNSEANITRYGTVKVELPRGLIISNTALRSLEGAFETSVANICRNFGLERNWLTLEIESEGSRMNDWESAEEFLKHVGIAQNPTGCQISFEFGATRVLIQSVVTRWAIVRGYFLELYFEPVTVENGRLNHLLYFLPSSFGGPPVNDEIRGWHPRRAGNISSSEDTLINFVFHGHQEAMATA